MSAVLDEPTRHKLSVTDYHRMVEAGILAPDARVELINGEIIDMAPISRIHSGVVTRLARILITTVGDRAIVRIQDASQLDNYSEPLPDVLVVKPRADDYINAETQPTPTDTYLLIEVAVSSVRYDREIKIPLYASRGVPAVLLIVPEEGSIYYYSNPSEGKYLLQTELTDLSSVPIGELPGCTMNLSQLLVY